MNKAVIHLLCQGRRQEVNSKNMLKQEIFVRRWGEHSFVTPLRCNHSILCDGCL